MNVSFNYSSLFLHQNITHMARILLLLQNTILPWRAIHVAGTNGKGSVCAYASAMLTAGKYGVAGSRHHT